MRKLLVCLFFVPASALLVAACGSDDPNGGSGAGAGSIATAAQFEDAFANASCGALQKCCDGVGEAPNPSCVELGKAKIAEKANKSGVVYDPSKGGACVQAVQAATCAGRFYDKTACRGVFTEPDGNKAPGDACEGDHECAGFSSGRAICFGSSVEVAQPTCKSIVWLGVGANCGSLPFSTTEATTCGEGLRCDFMGTNKCVKEREAGDACPDNDCGLDAQCVDGICVGPQPDLSTCESGGECVSGNCSNGKCALPSPGSNFCK